MMMWGKKQKTANPGRKGRADFITDLSLNLEMTSGDLPISTRGTSGKKN